MEKNHLHSLFQVIQLSDQSFELRA